MNNHQASFVVAMRKARLWYRVLRAAKDELGEEYAFERALELLGYTADWRPGEVPVVTTQTFRKSGGADDYERAYLSLPNDASDQVELDWIRKHPALSRRRRSSAAMGDVELTVEDILRPPHGRAPSRSAVNQLEYWANEPKEFFKMLLGRAKKAVEVEAEVKEQMKDLGIEEVRRLLGQVRGAKKEVVEPCPV